MATGAHHGPGVDAIITISRGQKGKQIRISSSTGREKARLVMCAVSYIVWFCCCLILVYASKHWALQLSMVTPWPPGLGQQNKHFSRSFMSGIHPAQHSSDPLHHSSEILQAREVREPSQAAEQVLPAARQQALSTLPPATGLPSDAWRPMLVKNCELGMPAQCAPCLPRTANITNLQVSCGAGSVDQLLCAA